MKIEANIKDIMSNSTGKTNSIALTEGPSRAAARAMLRGVGFTKEDLHKPIIGIANTWTCATSPQP
jgi:dihydroxy-acid dehydratase